MTPRISSCAVARAGIDDGIAVQLDGELRVEVILITLPAGQEVDLAADLGGSGERAVADVDHDAAVRHGGPVLDLDFGQGLAFHQLGEGLGAIVEAGGGTRADLRAGGRDAQPVGFAAIRTGPLIGFGERRGRAGAGERDAPGRAFLEHGQPAQRLSQGLGGEAVFRRGGGRQAHRESVEGQRRLAVADLLRLRYEGVVPGPQEGRAEPEGDAHLEKDLQGKLYHARAARAGDASHLGPGAHLCVGIAEHGGVQQAEEFGAELQAAGPRARAG